MPLYEYQCSNCQKVHEVIQKFSDAPLEVCPSCQGPLTKLMSMSSFSLKGTGWYTTDYKRTAAAAVKETDSGPSKGKEGSESRSSPNASPNSSPNSLATPPSGPTSSQKSSEGAATSQAKPAEVKGKVSEGKSSENKPA